MCNNCEWNRNYSSSNVTERALREIYLKGFEIAVKTSSPMTVMGSYNMVNGTYVNNSYDLLVKVLRDEWGFQGLVVSDWDSMKADPKDPFKPVSGDVLKAPAAQCDLIMPCRRRFRLPAARKASALRRQMQRQIQRHGVCEVSGIQTCFPVNLTQLVLQCISVNIELFRCCLE